MFDYISGKVAAVSENKVVIDCGGVGFSLTASAFACAEAVKKQEIKMPVYLAVRDDALELFGFSGVAERDLFMLLIGVSGVGPKLAVSVLSGMSAERLSSAIATGNAAALSTIKGVGKKTAERIVLELKGKVSPDVGDAPAVVTTEQLPDEKSVLALMGLGYERKEAENAVKKVFKPDMSTEDIVLAALRNL
ncbi:MAG: Holliday junction branch migration protein RuvA, partial [Clostridiales bacterium]|nr:Holliday junction branch migration protein RuvA [Clostridiales bacterium]